jgi:lipase chaperone LimK
MRRSRRLHTTNAQQHGQQHDRSRTYQDHRTEAFLHAERRTRLSLERIRMASHAGVTARERRPRARGWYDATYLGTDGRR